MLEAYTRLPEADRAVAMALSVLTDRIATLSHEDRNDLFQLLMDWMKSEDQDERQGILLAMEEILAQAPVVVREMTLAKESNMPHGLSKWAKHVGSKIRELREKAGLNQTQLAEKAGLSQSHVSRLENAEHSPANFTLQKIAQALGVSVSDIDPCFDE